jgi:hypothetical protein
MKKKFLVVWTVVLAIIFLYGCSENSDDNDTNDTRAPLVTREIFSNMNTDGDIVCTAQSSFSVSSASVTGNVFAGVDPDTGDEFRGFLDFPLDEPTGMPADAIIQSADLNIKVNTVSLPSADATAPMIIDMVDFQPPTLDATYYDREALRELLSLTPVPFYSSDAGKFVNIDVMPLMQEALRHGLPSLQLRFLLDLDVNSGLIEINDDDAPPLLTVTYY